MDPEIFNVALEMTLEWGENFHKPIQERLMHAYPTITQTEADNYDCTCREAMYYAFGEIERAYLKEIPAEEATANIVAKYPLINSDNWAVLWSQGQYYAWHDNG